MTAHTFLTLLATAFALDAWSTVYVIKHGGREANPILASLMRRLGTQGALVVVKVGAFGIVAYNVAAIGQPYRIAILLGYGAVMVWNLRLAVRLRRQAQETKQQGQ